MNHNPSPHIGLTGSTGFIGKALLESLKHDFTVDAIDLRKNSPGAINFAGTETIIHCAALVHQMHGAPAEEYYRVNTRMTEELAVKAKADGVGHFIFLSSSHVYGEYGNCFDHAARFKPSDQCHPADPYGDSKLKAEEVLKYLESPQFVVTIIRSPMVYGEDAKGNLRSLLKLIKAFPLLPFGEDRNKRSLIYIGNLVHFIRLTIQKKPSGILQAQDETPLSLAQIVSLLAESDGVKVRLFKLPRFLFRLLYKLRPNIFKKLFGSLALETENTNRVLNYSPPFSSREGFHRMIHN
jgi:nucleoside-diphosphate-sugar epimerase